jgi:GntR family transcriptional regulator / MocR family aminotransferase
VMAQLVVRAGTKVIMEAPGCAIVRNVFENYGGDVVSIPVDADGIAVDRLPGCRHALVFLTPVRHYPLGMALSRVRQQQLITWAEETDSQIIEVDFDGDFRYEGRPSSAMQTLDSNGRVTYVASFSSTLGPGLRIGYMVMPPPLVKAAIDAAMFLEYGFPCSGFPWLEQAVLNDFMVSGGYEKHLKRLRQIYRARRDVLIASIGRHFDVQSLSGLTCGTHIVWEVGSALPNATDVQSTAEEAGVRLSTLKIPSIADAEKVANWQHILLLGFAETPEADIERGISKLAAMLGLAKLPTRPAAVRRLRA